MEFELSNRTASTKQQLLIPRTARISPDQSPSRPEACLKQLRDVLTLLMSASTGLSDATKTRKDQIIDNLLFTSNHDASAPNCSTKCKIIILQSQAPLRRYRQARGLGGQDPARRDLSVPKIRNRRDLPKLPIMDDDRVFAFADFLPRRH